MSGDQNFDWAMVRLVKLLLSNGSDGTKLKWIKLKVSRNGESCLMTQEHHGPQTRIWEEFCQLSVKKNRFFWLNSMAHIKILFTDSATVPRVRCSLVSTCSHALPWLRVLSQNCTSHDAPWPGFPKCNAFLLPSAEIMVHYGYIIQLNCPLCRREWENRALQLPRGITSLWTEKLSLWLKLNMFTYSFLFAEELKIFCWKADHSKTAILFLFLLKYFVEKQLIFWLVVKAMLDRQKHISLSARMSTF